MKFIIATLLLVAFAADSTFAQSRPSNLRNRALKAAKGTKDAKSTKNGEAPDLASSATGEALELASSETGEALEKLVIFETDGYDAIDEDEPMSLTFGLVDGAPLLSSSTKDAKSSKSSGGYSRALSSKSTKKKSEKNSSDE